MLFDGALSLTPIERLGDRGRPAEVVRHRLEGSVAVGTVCDRLKQLAGANEVNKRVSIVAGRRNEKYHALVLLERPQGDRPP